MPPILPILFAAAFCFVFLSAATADALGLKTLRVPVFAGLVALMCGLAVLRAPALSGHGRGHPLACATILLLLLPFQIHAPLDPLDWKIALVLLILLLGPELARALAPVDVPALINRLLAFYVVVSSTILFFGDPARLVRGSDGLMRLDISGSVVTHACLCAIYFLLACERLVAKGATTLRLWYLGTGVLALTMMVLAATRTAILTLVLALLFHFATRPRGESPLVIFLPLLATLVFISLCTFLGSDTLWLRLIGAGEDFTSGRGHSLPFWLGQAISHPFGLGIGAVRRMFAEGQPLLEGGQTLEWPHNEFVRFWVEGGWLGLLFALLLILGLVARTLRAARAMISPRARWLALALAADLLAQSLLQNYFNNIYYATMMTAVLMTLLCAPAGSRGPSLGRSAVPLVGLATVARRV